MKVFLILLCLSTGAFARGGGGESYSGGGSSYSGGSSGGSSWGGSSGGSSYGAGSSYSGGSSGGSWWGGSSRRGGYYDSDDDYDYSYRNRYRYDRYPYGRRSPTTGLELFFWLVAIVGLTVARGFLGGGRYGGGWGRRRWGGGWGTRWGGDGPAVWTAGGVDVREYNNMLPGGQRANTADIPIPPPLPQALPPAEAEPVLAEAKTAFLAVQEAWSARDMRGAREHMSDALYDRFAVQLELQRRAGVRNQMSRTRVLEAAVVSAESGTSWDVAHVRVRAEAVDETFDLADNRRLRGGQPEQFTEVWSFLRRSGGAWRACEITQLCDWAGHGSKEVPGAGPGVCAQELEDRASAVFWRWALACVERSAEPLKPAAAPELLSKFSPVDFREPAVGMARLLAFEGGGAPRAHVEVKWSCHGHGGATVLRHVVTMRQEGEKWLGEAIQPISEWSAPKGAKVSHDWAAPLSTSDSVALMAAALTADGQVTAEERRYLDEYATARGVSREAVDKILEAAAAGRLETPKPSSGEEAESALKGLIHASLSDGALTDGEMALMTAFAAKLGLPARQLDSLIAEERLK